MSYTEARALLKSFHLRITRARLLIIQQLAQNDKPVSVPELITRLSHPSSSPDPATVYRCIDTFLQAGVIQQLDFHEGMFRYELSHHPHHHHLVCQSCGTIKPIYDQCLNLSNTQIQSHYGFKVSKHILEFLGLCQDCQSHPIN